jgi:regulation of enolase protein 1 (concanavalin A-like superfamily)/dienelactone hydrolase
VLVVLVLLGLATAPASCATYDLTLGNGQFYRCEIDDHLTAVRGIWWYINGDGDDDRGWTANADVQAICRHWGFAAIATAGVGELYYNDDPLGADRTIQNALDNFAVLSGHAEIATVPWAITGFSSGGYFATHEAIQRPDRVIAVAAVHGGDIPAGGASSGFLGLPCLIVAGDNDGVIPVTDLYFTFLNGRAQGARCAFAIDWGSQHEVQNYGTHLEAAWLDDAVQRRYPPAQTGAELLAEDPAPACLADAAWASAAAADERALQPPPSTQVMPVPVGMYAGDPLTASWLPDPGIADVFAAASSLVYPKSVVPFAASPLHLDNPPQDPAAMLVLTGSTVGTTLSVDATAIPGVDAVTFADAGITLGTVNATVAAAAGPRWQMATTLAGGVHPITATAIDGSGHSWLAMATMVVDDGPPAGVVWAPTVSVDTPGDGASVQLPAVIPLEASATAGGAAITRVDFQVDGVTVASAATAPFTASWNVGSPGAHQITALATDAGGLTAVSNPVQVATYRLLPAPWQHDDIGSVFAIGDAMTSDGQTFTVTGSGPGLANGQDAGHWVWQSLGGDGDLVAEITAVPTADLGGMAGIIVRDGEFSDDPFVALMAYAGGVVQLVSRDLPGDGLTTTATTTYTLPCWLSLQRRGDAFTAAVSEDGSTWTTLGSVGVAMPDGANAGLFAASNLTHTGTAQFAQVSLTIPPAITSPSQARGVVGQPFSFPITAPGATVAVTGLPAGLAFNPVSATISGIPVATGMATVQVAATGAGGTGYQELSLAVYSPLPSPWTIDPIAGPVAGNAVALPPDADGNASFTLSGAGSGIDGAADSGMFCWQGISGDISIVARITPPTGSGSLATAGVMMRSSLDPGAPYAYAVIQADGSIGFQVRNQQGAMSFGDGGGTISGPWWLRIQRQGDQCTCSASADGATWNLIGAHVVPLGNPIGIGMVVASDDPTQVVTSAFDEVAIISAPTLADQTLAVAVDDLVDLPLVAGNDPTSWTSDPLPAALSLDPDTGRITGRPAMAGTATAAITASNQGGDAQATLTITVAPAQAVALSVAPAVASVIPGQRMVFTVTALDPAGVAIPSPPVTWSVDADGTITGSGTYTATAIGRSIITASGGGMSATALVTVSPIPVLPPVPVITGAATASAWVGAPFTYAITATGQPTAYAAAGVPAGLLVDGGTGVITGTPTAAGIFTMTMSATNAGGTGVAVVTLTVLPAIPVITSPSALTIHLGDALTYAITATDAPTAYAATPLPSGLMLAGSGVITGTPTMAGTTVVTVSATNAGGTGSAAVTIDVLPAVPLITSALNADTVGSAFHYQITASGDPTSFSALDLPSGLVLDPATGVISGSSTDVGAHEVTITAINAGGMGSAILYVTVNPATPATSAAGTTGTAVGGNGGGGCGLASGLAAALALAGLMRRRLRQH